MQIVHFAIALSLGLAVKGKLVLALPAAKFGLKMRRIAAFPPIGGCLLLRFLKLHMFFQQDGYTN